MTPSPGGGDDDDDDDEDEDEEEEEAGTDSANLSFLPTGAWDVDGEEVLVLVVVLGESAVGMSSAFLFFDIVLNQYW